MAKKIALSLASLALSLVLLEIVLRVSGFDPYRRLIEGASLIVRPSAQAALRYELTPGAEGPGFHTYVRVSSQGLRDREYPREKDGSYRIAVVGDSITFGNMLGEEDLYPTRLESRLNEQSERPVEVVNLGVPGYDIVQNVARLEHHGLQFDPDLVVLGYCSNDIISRSLALEYIRHLGRLESPWYRLRTVQFAEVTADSIRALRAHFLPAHERDFFEANRAYIADLGDDPDLLAMMDHARARGEQARRSKSFSFLRRRSGLYHWYGSPARIGMLRFAFEWLARLQDQHGFDVLVVVFPRLEDRDINDIVRRIVSHEAERLGFPVVSLAAAFEEVGYEALRIVWVDKDHPNERGHEIIADELEDYLLANAPIGNGGDSRTGITARDGHPPASATSSRNSW